MHVDFVALPASPRVSSLSLSCLASHSDIDVDCRSTVTRLTEVGGKNR